ncbi:DUF6392 family protein [Enterobacteriaceae bacterium LUAb1]
MTVNVTSFLYSFGKRYQEMCDEGIIPYKTKPTGFSGDPDLSLNMAKEGIYLSFRRDGYIFQEISLRIQNDKISHWLFPNELPLGLEKKMSIDWVHSNFGGPLRSVEPKVVMRKYVGRAELYQLEGFNPPVSMQIRYDSFGFVKKITFLPTSDLRW